VRNAKSVDAAGHVRHNAVDRRVGTDAGTVDRPRREDVSEAVELSGGAKDLDDIRMLRGADAVLQRLPESLTFALEDRGVLIERPFDAAKEVEDVVHALRLCLCVPDERGAQTPIVRAAAFGEVDQTGECRRLDFGCHVTHLKTATAGYA
jgi:hypothetical protein